MCKDTTSWGFYIDKGVPSLCHDKRIFDFESSEIDLNGAIVGLRLDPLKNLLEFVVDGNTVARYQDLWFEKKRFNPIVCMNTQGDAVEFLGERDY